MNKHFHIKSGLRRNLLIFGGLLLFAVFQAMSLGGQTGHPQADVHHKNVQDSVPKATFNAGEFIIDHIVDAHEWHILSLGDFHLTLPLPVILWHKGALHVFMSSRFNHGHAQYKDFAMANEGVNKGKIVEMLTVHPQDDQRITTVESEELPLDFSITKNTAVEAVKHPKEYSRCWSRLSFLSATTSPKDLLAKKNMNATCLFC
jgi:hypothetical protein